MPLKKQNHHNQRTLITFQSPGPETPAYTNIKDTTRHVDDHIHDHQEKILIKIKNIHVTLVPIHVIVPIPEIHHDIQIVHHHDIHIVHHHVLVHIHVLIFVIVHNHVHVQIPDPIPYPVTIVKSIKIP